MLKVQCEFCSGVFNGTWEMAVHQEWKELLCYLVVPEKKSEPFLTGHACPVCVERVPKLLRLTLFRETAPELLASEHTLPASLDEVEKVHILSVLELTKWNKSQAAVILGIERSTLDRKLKVYEVKRPAALA